MRLSMGLNVEDMTLRKGPRIGVDHAPELGSGGVVEIAAVADRLEEIALLAAQQSQEPFLERLHPHHRNRIEIAALRLI
jgi:hypothetical protein